MNRARQNFVVDVLAALMFVLCAATGIMKLGSHGGGGWQGGGNESILGLSGSTVTQIHDVSGEILIFLVLVHIWLHREWIVCMVKGFFGKKADTCKKE